MSENQHSDLPLLVKNVVFDCEILRKEKTMKRQSVTLTRRFLDLTAELNNQDRLTAYDKIFSHLFNEIPIETKGESDAVRVTLACLAPELRKAQAQYENGVVAKKLTTKSQGLFCPHDGSQQQANNKPEWSQSSPIYNNIINNNNIRNNQTIPNQKNENYTFEQQNADESESHVCNQIKKSNKEEREFYASVLEENIQRIENVELQERVKTLVNKIAHTTTAFRIRNNEVTPEEVLCKMVDIFRTDNVNKIEMRLASVYEDLATREKVSNKFKYLVSSMYREACDSI